MIPVKINGRTVRVASRREAEILEARIRGLETKGHMTNNQIRKEKLGPRSVAGNPIAGWVSTKNDPKHLPDDRVLVYTTDKRGR